MQVNPNYADAFYGLGTVLYSDGDWSNAIAAFRSATQLNPKFANAYYGAGMTFLKQKNYPEAKRVLEFAKTEYQRSGNRVWVDRVNGILSKI